MNCSYECIAELGVNRTSICEYVALNCKGQPFTSLHYCTFQQSALALILFSAVLALLVYYFLSSLTDNFLQPALKTVYTNLGISETLAGLTFMAFGNGGPDVITAVVGSNDDDGQGALLPVGTLFGAALIATCLITGLAIDASPTTMTADPATIIRDISFYLLASVTLLVYGLVGYINAPMACVFFLYYLVYIVIVLRHERLKNGSEQVGDTSPSEISPQSLDSPI